MSEPRYFLDDTSKITVGQISADKLHYDWELQQFVFRNVPLTAEEHFQRAARLIAQVEAIDKSVYVL